MDKAKQEKLLSLVRDNYEAIAADFNQTRHKALWPALIDFGRLVKDGQSVLDVGCGNGRLLRAFADRQVGYLGVDQSASLIGLARQNAAKASGVAAVADFLIGDILTLDELQIGGFDWVFSVAVLHHLPGADLQLRALQNLKARLKPGGELVISVWRPWGNKKLLNVLAQTIGRKLAGRHPYGWNDLVFAWSNNQSPRYYHLFTKRELKKLLAMAGLEAVEWRTEQRNYFLRLRASG